MESISKLQFFDDLELSESIKADFTSPTKVKAVSPPLLIDEDSGLGLEYDAEERDRGILTPQKDISSAQSVKNPLSFSRRSLFNGQKRCLIAGDEDGSITKKRRRPCQKNSPLCSTKHLFFSVEDSTSDGNISEVVDKFVANENLIGNGAKSFCLPTVPGRHSDLKSITSETLVDLLTGRYDDVMNNYRIIDCRYPYEYNGGHIQGSENRYTEEQILEILQTSAATGREVKRDILIFHCEFSSERGPKMCRLLRNQDREINKDRYPYLHFPEIYLLHDGYKAFFEFDKELCEPKTYKPMLHSSHSDDLRHFRAKSKSWSNGQKRRKRTQRLLF